MESKLWFSLGYGIEAFTHGNPSPLFEMNFSYLTKPAVTQATTKHLWVSVVWILQTLKVKHFFQKIRNAEN